MVIRVFGRLIWPSTLHFGMIRMGGLFTGQPFAVSPVGGGIVDLTVYELSIQQI